MIEDKRAALEAATIVRFGETGIRIVKGRFGPYISDGKRRARIPKTRASRGKPVGIPECEAYLAEAEAAKPVKGGRKKSAAKPAAKASRQTDQIKATGPPKKAVRRDRRRRSLAAKKAVR